MFTKGITLWSDDDYSIQFNEWSEVSSRLEVVYIFDSGNKITLPVMDADEWESFKRAGDEMFNEMGL